MSYAQLNAAQLDLEPLLSSLVKSKNIKTRDSVSLVKLFINSSEDTLRNELHIAHQQCVAELILLFKNGIQPNPDPINAIWVKENLLEMMLYIVEDFEYEIDAESIELFVAVHQADLIEFIDELDFDRPSL